MPRICTVCAHERRRKIDAAIVFGKSNRTIANQFRLTAASVQRHKTHVAAALERASEKRELSIGESILDRLETLYQHGIALLNSTEKAKNHSASIGYLRELRGILAGLYEVSKTVVPASARRAPMAADYIEAVREALGMSGKLIPVDANGDPIDDNDKPLLTAGEGEVDLDEVLPTLPQD